MQNQIKINTIFTFRKEKQTTLETYYLIDYENCSKDGLNGSDKLKGTDHIYLLYTENHKNITLDFFENHGKATLEIKKVPVGDQSLDKHLIAYLGYLIGKSNCSQAEYVIITSDKGYDKVGAFMEEQCDNIKVVRKSKISEHLGVTKKADKKTIVKKKVEAEKNVNNSGKKKEQAEKNSKETQKTGEEQANKHNEIQQILSKAKVEKDVLSFVPGFVIKNMGNQNPKMTIYRGMVQKFGQKKGLDVYTRIKKHI